jgi:hypothetical protein
MAKKKKKITPADIRAKHKREAMKEAGAYDGRYKPKVFKDKSKYSRKNKRGGKNNNTEGEL